MTPSSGLKDRVALVSGGARGIGAAHVRALHSAGAHVAIGDVLRSEGAALAEELGERATFVPLDVARADDWDKAVKLAESVAGAPVSILVNNAGVSRPALIEDTTPENWDLVLGVNLTGHFLGIRAVISPMRRAGGGAIVNTSSMTAHEHPSGMAAYSASKHGVIALTRIAALELARDRIRVNALHPGMIETDMTAGSDRTGTLPRIPLRRYGTPEEVAATMIFIVRDAHYATGSDFFIDGGILAGRERQLAADR